VYSIMSYNTKAIKTDVSGSKPVPQHYNSEINDYEVIQGAYGASRVLLYDANGSPLLTSANPGIVKIADELPAGDNKIGSVDAVITGSNAIIGAVQNVTTAGTRVQLPNYPCREVTLIARKGNVGSIYVGGTDVSSALFGAELAAKDSVTLAVSNTNLIWLDSSVNGEGISYVAV
jgi:hypothetical protein